MVFASMDVVSQINPPPPDTDGSGSGPGFDDDTDDELIPINGLVALGLLAGAIYGIRKKR